MRRAHLNIETNALCICGGRKAFSSAERDSVSPTLLRRRAKPTSQFDCFLNVLLFIFTLYSYSLRALRLLFKHFLSQK